MARFAIPWIFRQSADALAGTRSRRPVSLEERGQFLLDYIDLLLKERVDEAPASGTLRPQRRERADALDAECRLGARPGALGDQQAARAGLLVHEGARRRLSAASGDQLGRVDSDHLRDIIARLLLSAQVARACYQIRLFDQEFD